MAWVLGIAFDQKIDMKRSVGIVVQQENDFNKFKKILPAVDDSGKNNSVIQSGNFEFRKMTESESITAIKKGKISIYIKYFSSDNSIKYFFDPKNSEASGSYLQLEKYINGKYESGIKNSVSELKEIGSRYIDFFLPGLIALQIMNSCIWGIGWSLIELRTKKLMRRMYATPMNRGLFMLSFFMTRMVLSVFESVLLYLFAFLYFDMRISGSIAALAAVMIAGNAVFSGIAILMGSKTSSSRVGNGLLNAITMPMMVLSGIFFSYHNFPEWTASLINKLPLTMLADSIRAVFIENAGMSEVALPIVIMTISGFIFTWIGLKIFKWY
jgi:ABC-type multidrug transport system permease subunit